MKLYCKTIILMLLLLGLVKCTQDLVSSIPGAPSLTTGLDTNYWQEFESSSHGIKIKYPNDWAIDGSGDLFIIIAPNEDMLLSQYGFYVIPMKPYVKRGNQRLNIPQPTLEVAQELANNWTKTGAQLINPVTNVDINGYDGAIFLIEDNQNYLYTIALRLTQHEVIVLNAKGSGDDIEEIQSTLNAIALTIQHLAE